MKSAFQPRPIAFVATLALVSATAALAQSKPGPDLTQPAIPRTIEERVKKMHAEFLARAKQGNVGLLFLGDSITAGWTTKAKDVFDREYAQYHPANFGIGGDHVNGVLWRVLNGELDGISPKLIVLMIGTNNSASNTGDEIAAGVEHLIKGIREKSPTSKILLLGMLPRGPRDDKPVTAAAAAARMRVIRTANDRLKKLDNGTTLRYLDVGHAFLDKDGKIPKDLMPDQLHPNKKGYELWADAMRPMIAEMMK